MQRSLASKPRSKSLDIPRSTPRKAGVGKPDEFLPYDATIETTLRVAQAKLSTLRVNPAQLMSRSGSRVSKNSDTRKDSAARGEHVDSTCHSSATSLSLSSNSHKVPERHKRGLGLWKEIEAGRKERMRCMRRFI